MCWYRVILSIGTKVSERPTVFIFRVIWIYSLITIWFLCALRFIFAGHLFSFWNVTCESLTQLPLSLCFEVLYTLLGQYRFYKIYHWLNKYGRGHKIWVGIHKHEVVEKSVLSSERSVCWGRGLSSCYTNLTKSFWRYTILVTTDKL